MKKNIVLLVSAVVLSVFCANAKAEPFQNGSFEEGPVIDSGYVTLYAGSTEITGWTVDSGSIDLIGDYWMASDGDRSIDLSGDGPGAISQTFDTVTDAWYQVQFDMAGSPDDPGLKVLVVSTDTTEDEYEFDSTGTDDANMNWTENYFVFQALGDMTTLQFMAVSPDTAFGPALDNVVVTRIPRPFPADVMRPTGAVHAYSKGKKKGKKIRLVIKGYVVDELSMARDGEGIGISYAFLKINGRKIILKNKRINRLDENGKFKIVRKVKAKKGKVYKVRLFAADTVSVEDGGPNKGRVDATYVRIAKKEKKHKKHQKHKKDHDDKDHDDKDHDKKKKKDHDD